MQKFKGDFLSVRTPKTTDGVLPKIVDGKQQYKTTSLPLTAKKHLERMNKKLPDHLKMTWEVMRNEPVIQQLEIKQATKAKGKQAELPIQDKVNPGATDYDLEAAFGKGI